MHYEHMLFALHITISSSCAKPIFIYRTIRTAYYSKKYSVNYASEL